jgi:hypothetical protein
MRLSDPMDLAAHHRHDVVFFLPAGCFLFVSAFVVVVTILCIHNQVCTFDIDI